jgi:electron transfer flavoprotein beta subunit
VKKSRLLALKRIWYNILILIKGAAKYFMKIIVCIKQVPDSTMIKIDPIRGTMIREGVASIINPDDKNALEEALRLRERFPGTSITVISMGPNQALSAIREAMAMGVEKAILLTDPAFSGSDTQATAIVLAAAIRKIAEYDIIICGRQAIDGDTAQVGPQLAEYLDLPQITYVSHIDIEYSSGAEAGASGNGTVVAHRRYEDGFFVMRSPFPVLLTVIKELNIARLPSISGIRAAFSNEVRIWGREDIDADPAAIGLDGSPTKVLRSFVPRHNSRVEFLEGSPRAMAGVLLHKLREEHVVAF